MSAKNAVIAGDYEGKGIIILRGFPEKVAIILKAFGKDGKIILDKTAIENYEVVTEESSKSASSAIARGAMGGFLLGPIGLLAGISAKNKNSHTVAIQFKDGKKSLIEVDGKIYKALIKELF